MVKIAISKLKDVDLKKLAEFTFKTRQASQFYSDARTLDRIERSLGELTQDDHSIGILAESSDEIVGAMQLYTGFPDMAFISNWHPIVKQTTNRAWLAQSLIHVCKEHVKEIGLERLEVNISPIQDSILKARDEHKLWYETSGFHRATKEVFMRVDLENLTLPSAPPALPEGFRIEETDKVENKDIENSFFDSFRHGKNRLFLDVTETQQKTAFNYWFNRNRPLHRASVLVLMDEKVVGFSIVRPDEESVEIGPVGVVPKYWRMGIMKAVLHETIIRLQEENVKSAQLEADVDNTPAVNLYKMYGFEQIHTQEYYAWKTSDP